MGTVPNHPDDTEPAGYVVTYTDRHGVERVSIGSPELPLTHGQAQRHADRHNAVLKREGQPGEYRVRTVPETDLVASAVECSEGHRGAEA